VTNGPGSPLPTQEQWRHVRRHLNGHRHHLALLAAQLYPSSWQVADSPLLARSEWIPATPIALEHVQLMWCDRPHHGGITGNDVAWRSTLPLRGDGRRFASYAQALAALDPPRLLEDRAAYRLLEVGLRDAGAELRFTRGSYFDVIDICEAVAHELTASVQARGDSIAVPAMRQLPLRASIDDPTDLARRPVIPAISVLTLRREGPEAATCLLHWRDAAKVASGGGLYQVAPVGLFQPSSDATFNEANDFDLWRSITRELSEELLGASEDHGSDHRPIDYERWPFHATLAAARREGALRVFWLGLGVDPLTLSSRTCSWSPCSTPSCSTRCSRDSPRRTPKDTSSGCTTGLAPRPVCRSPRRPSSASQQRSRYNPQEPPSYDSHGATARRCSALGRYKPSARSL
jgi:hypothetical protein